MPPDPRIVAAPWFQAPETKTVIQVLGADKARFVGGIVRDTLLDRLPAHEAGKRFGDVDISTIHKPDRVAEMAEAAGLKVVPTGIDHGTVTVVVNSTPYEITSLRKDVETDGRRAVVSYTEDWAEDAVRRDFTFNALYADAEGHIYDVTGEGLDDLEARKVRFIGDASIRIREDYLRILRYFRFVAMLGDDTRLDEEAIRTCAQLKDGIDNLSAERLHMEMMKLLSLPDPLRAMRAMEDAGVLQKVIGHGHCGLWFRHLCKAEWGDRARKTVALFRLNALKPFAGNIRRMRFSNAENRMLDLLEKGERLAAIPSRQSVLTALYRYGREEARALFAAYEHHPDAECDDWPAIHEMAAQAEVPVLPVQGKDLLAKGLNAGPEMGEALKALEQRWIDSGYEMAKKELLSGL